MTRGRAREPFVPPLRPITMRTHRHLLAAVLVAGLALAPLAACGSSGSEPVASGEGPTTTTAADPDASQSSPASPGDPTATTLDPSDPDATVDTEMPAEVTPEEAAVLVGLTEAEATAEAEARGWSLRVARLDGEDLALTEDYSPTRVNVAVEAGEVTEIVSIG